MKNGSIHFALYKAFHAQKNAIRPGMSRLGLSPGQPKILHQLLQKNGCRQKDLADSCDISPATISHILDNMEQQGYLRRQQEIRSCSITITEAGRQAYAEWETLCAEMETLALQGFSREEKKQFLEFLQRMYGNLTIKDAGTPQAEQPRRAKTREGE